MNIYVSNLDYLVEDDDLRGFFEEYGEVESARVITDRETRRSRGFGFVEMPDAEAAEKAIKELNGSHVKGRAINVTEAKPREEKSNNNRNFSYRN
jgi:RNA recognition motif-containing protein